MSSTEGNAGFGLPGMSGPEIEFLIISDRAEVISGKLYMMGGGWDQTIVSDPKQPVNISLAVSVLVPWHEANETHQLTLHIEQADSSRVTPEFQAAVTAGRPPNAVKGQSFRAMLTLTSAFQLPGPGTYAVVARLPQGPTKRVVFSAVQGPVMAQPQPGR